MDLRSFLKRTPDVRPADIARSTGLDVSSFSRYLSGERGFSAETIKSIIEFTGNKVTFDAICQEREELRAQWEARPRGAGDRP